LLEELSSRLGDFTISKEFYCASTVIGLLAKQAPTSDPDDLPGHDFKNKFNYHWLHDCSGVDVSNADQVSEFCQLLEKFSDEEFREYLSSISEVPDSLLHKMQEIKTKEPNRYQGNFKELFEFLDMLMKLEMVDVEDKDSVNAFKERLEYFNTKYPSYLLEKTKNMKNIFFVNLWLIDHYYGGNDENFEEIRGKLLKIRFGKDVDSYRRRLDHIVAEVAKSYTAIVKKYQKYLLSEIRILNNEVREPIMQGKIELKRRYIRGAKHFCRKGPQQVTPATLRSCIEEFNRKINVMANSVSSPAMKSVQTRSNLVTAWVKHKLKSLIGKIKTVKLIRKVHNCLVAKKTLVCKPQYCISQDPKAT
jgi:hypothetical protein